MDTSGYELVIKEKDARIAKLIAENYMLGNIIEKVSARLEKRLWKDSGHHCESRSVLMACRQIIDAALSMNASRIEIKPEGTAP